MEKQIEKTEENRIKHLEFIENNITRMNSCSFQIKGWTVTIVSALIALYAASTNDCGERNNIFILSAVVPTILFWLLDSYYLQKERKFMQLYKDVAGISDAKKLIDSFDLSIRSYNKNRNCGYFKALMNTAGTLLYVIIIIGLIILYMCVK